MKPYLKNTVTEKVLRATTRRLCESDLSAVLQLQSRALAHDSSDTQYQPLTKDGFLALMQRGELLGIFTDEGLCGVCGVAPASEEMLEYAADCGIFAQEEPLCAVLDALLVSPDYHGNGIARELILCCIRRAVEGLSARYVLAAVSPKNVGCILALMSLNNVRLKALRQSGEGRLRYIFCYTHDDKRLFTVYERYAIHDVFSISRALANHSEGIASFRGDGDTFLWLAK